MAGYQSKFKGAEVDGYLEYVKKLKEEGLELSDYAKKEDLDNKQDAIPDLDAIRSGSKKGATALQFVPSEYVTETELTNKGYATTAALNKKVDKVSGKQLSTEDFTSALKTKLEGLSNYDDTELSNALSTLRGDFDALVSGDTTTAIKSYNDIIAFLDGIQDTQDLSSIIAGIQQQIANVRDAIPTMTSQLTNDSGFLTEHQDISGKQDKIDDLDAIRSGAEKGATALQEVPSTYVTEAELNDKMKNLVDEDGYVYSAGEKVDMRFTRSLLPVGTSIPASANLNTIEFLKIGKYYCSQNVDAKTVKNCPVNMAFSMEVFNPLGTNIDDETTADYTYRLRVLTPYDTGIHYIQCCRTSGTPGTWTYDSWYVTPRSKFTLASSKNDGSAAIGSTNKGVYIDSNGEIKAMSYTVGKSVPTNAVFTDTNTKVTAVENHYTPTEDEDQQINAPSGEVVIGIKRDAAGHIVGVVSTPQTGGEEGGGGDSFWYEGSEGTAFCDRDIQVDGNIEANGTIITGSIGVPTSEGEGYSTGDKGQILVADGNGGIEWDDLSIPTKISELENDEEYLDKTTAEKSYTKLETFESSTYVKVNGIADTRMAYALPTSANGDEDDILLSLFSTKTFNGESIYGEGNITFPNPFIADFTIEELRNLVKGEIDQIIMCDKGGLKQALAEHRPIFIPQSQAEQIIGYSVMSGYYEDLLYLQVISELGELFIIETDTTGYTSIYNSEVHCSILTDEDSSLYGSYARYVHDSTEIELQANTYSVIFPLVSDNLTISLSENYNTSYTAEYIIRFKIDPSSDGAELIVPENILWAEGLLPAMTSGKTYEISFLRIYNSDNITATFLEF